MRENLRQSLDRTVLILGAPGLVGAQVTRQIARELGPDKIVVAALEEDEIKRFAGEVGGDFPFKEYGIDFVPEWGNIFVRSEFAKQKRAALVGDPGRRRALYEDLFGSFLEAYERSEVVRLIREHRPDVVIDCINTATGISYQDVDASCKEVRQDLDFVTSCLMGNDFESLRARREAMEESIEMLLVSQSIPQLIRHIRMLHKAMVDNKTRIYIKVGTTGTGGMGLNIPYTHGEDKPSAKLMSKSSIGFAQTGLMFLMARTPGGPIVKEIKPGAMIGYKKVTVQPLRTRHKFVPQQHPLGGTLQLSLPENDFKDLGKLEMVGVDTGENGFFARGEFEAVTSINQMEFVTPEEISRAIVLEIKGSNTGLDVIAAIDSSIMKPSYRAGYLRLSAIESLRRLEDETNSHSVATGELGPPKLTKLLYEAHLLYKVSKDLKPPGKLKAIISQSAEEISHRCERYLEYDEDLRNTITSIGIPILLPAGDAMIRGPHIKVPEARTGTGICVHDGDVEVWAASGWVDLRPRNIQLWQKRFSDMLESAENIHLQGSAGITMEAYRSEEIRIGEVVGWILNNEEKGYRIK
jgi:hypothetical protein